MNELPIVYFIIDTNSITEKNQLSTITSAILISKPSLFEHWRLNIITDPENTVLTIPDGNIPYSSSVFYITSNKNGYNRFEKQNIWNITIILDNHLKIIESQNHWDDMKVFCPIFLPEIISAIIIASIKIKRWLPECCLDEDLNETFKEYIEDNFENEIINGSYSKFVNHFNTLNNRFTIILIKIILKYGLEIFDNIQRCKSLLKDYSTGWFKWEIKYFIAAIEINAPKKIIETNKANIDKTNNGLISELKVKCNVSNQMASDIILLLCYILNSY
jgi:hypothetical protein